MQVLDTNVLLRFLTGDDANQSPRTFNYFGQVQAGDIGGILLEGVIVETIQVLESRRYFKGHRVAIADGLKAIVSLPGLRVHNRHRQLEALDIFANTNLDYVDCLLVVVARSEGSGEILSFDRDYDGIAGIVRVEP